MTTTLIPSVHPFNDKVASTYFSRGTTPEEAMVALKSVNFTIGTNKVQGTVIANILRGMYLAQALLSKPTTKRRSAKV